jgi:hypothetical protein
MTTGVLPYRTFKDDVLWNTGFFECSSNDLTIQQGTSSGNHDGAGMSMGNLQYNFGAANRLNELWNYMLDNYEQDCIDSFGTNTTEYQTWKTAVRSTIQADKINFGASITDPNNDHAVIEPYKSAFATLGNKPNHIAKYKAMADSYYFPPAETLFLQMSCTSRLAYASLFDCYINKGRYYPINLICADFDRIDADTTIDAAEKERQKIYQINERANSEENAVNDTSTATFAPRRNAMRDQGGDYYGLAYVPSNFDMNQEPAMSQKAPSTGLNFGPNTINAVYAGTNKLSDIYFGSTKLGSGVIQTTIATAPKTQFRINGGSYAGIGTASSITLNVGQPLWIDVQENPTGTLVACRTYYTIDGTTPTTSSALYTEALTFDASCTLKTLTVSLSGVAEAVKTLTVNVAAPPVTTISPTEIVQNSIPITVTLTTSEAGAQIYYKLGNSATQYTYTAPFQVSQDSAGVTSTQITVTYWSVGANGTETAKTITYDTSGALPAAATLTATAGNNQVNLSWTAAANVTSYTVYRSTAAGTLGTWIGTSQYLTKTTTSLVDTGVTAGTTYYYTVYTNNYQTHSTSNQASATPTAAPSKASYRFLKIQGYGTATDTTSRIIEFEAISAGVNRMTGATILSSDAPNNTGTAAQIKDGTKTTTSNSYPLWWSAVPNANIVVDLGASYAIDQMNYFSYSVSGDQRANRFKILGSNTNNGTDWVSVWDMSANTTVQPILPSGYNITF